MKGLLTICLLVAATYTVVPTPSAVAADTRVDTAEWSYGKRAWREGKWDRGDVKYWFGFDGAMASASKLRMTRVYLAWVDDKQVRVKYVRRSQASKWRVTGMGMQRLSCVTTSEWSDAYGAQYPLETEVIRWFGTRGNVVALDESFPQKQVRYKACRNAGSYDVYYTHNEDYPDEWWAPSVGCYEGTDTVPHYCPGY